MDGELVRVLYHEFFHNRKLRTDRRCSYRDAIILWIYFLGVLHDRSTHWAHDRRNWPIWARRVKAPSYSQLMRRLQTPAIRAHIADLHDALLQRLPRAAEKAVDGKPLTVGAYTNDPEAACGYVGPGRFARGYKLHAIVNKHGVIETFSVTGLNVGESTVARKMVRQTDLRGAILRGDANYDRNPLYDAVARRGGRLLAPRSKPGGGIGHRPHHPDRLRAIIDFERSADRGRMQKRHRLRIEQSFGHLTNLPFGLAPLPNCVRRLVRVERWIAAKIILYHLYLIRKKTEAKAA